MPRATFFEEQARYRRASWRWTLAAAVAVAIMGLPLSLVLTPLIYFLLLLALHLTHLVVAWPDAVWRSVDWLAGHLPRAIDTWEQTGRLPWGEAALPAVLLTAPGACALLVVWLTVRRLLAQAGTEATLSALAARPLVTGDLEERQVRNIVDEMAIAAGVPSPPIQIADGLPANRAVLGSSPESAALVVSRRVLDVCDRSETQGLVAHALAYIAHDDLAIADRIESVRLTGAALHALVNAPFGGGRELWSVVSSARRSVAAHATRRKRRSRRCCARGRAVRVISTGSWRRTTSGRRAPFETVRNITHFVLMPLYLLNVSVSISAWLVHMALVGPMFALLWRARRYLADATAVQLTRDPSDLSRALTKLLNEPFDGWTRLDQRR